VTRVVVTGLGVVSPIGHGLAEFEQGLREGCSGIRFQPELDSLEFGCQVAGMPTGLGDLAVPLDRPTATGTQRGRDSGGCGVPLVGAGTIAVCRGPAVCRDSRPS